jgi:hypothetical protein
MARGDDEIGVVCSFVARASVLVLDADFAMVRIGAIDDDPDPIPSQFCGREFGFCKFCQFSSLTAQTHCCSALIIFDRDKYSSNC